MARLNKFPVTTPEGIRYRVTIIEVPDDTLNGGPSAYAKVKIYTERAGRKLFRFKRLTTVCLVAGNGYNARNPDFIAITTAAITRYHNYLATVAEHNAKADRLRNEIESERQRQITKFNEWDGGL